MTYSNFRNDITVIIVVKNEEKRIKSTLNTFKDFSNIILLDKNSDDNTIQTVHAFKNITCLKLPDDFDFEKEFFSEIKFLINKVNTKWVMPITASDIISKELVEKIKFVFTKTNIDEYDQIELPYMPYFLGVNAKFSPWYSEYRGYIFKTKNVMFNEKSVHKAFYFKSRKIFRIQKKNTDAFYHLTHENFDGVLDRYYRYLKLEKYDEISLNFQLKYILKQIIKLFFLKGNIFRGKDAIALSFSFLSYHLLKYVAIWDNKYGKGNQTYNEIRKKVVDDWEA